MRPIASETDYRVTCRDQLIAGHRPNLLTVVPTNRHQHQPEIRQAKSVDTRAAAPAIAVLGDARAIANLTEALKASPAERSGPMENDADDAA